MKNNNYIFYKYYYTRSLNEKYPYCILPGNKSELFGGIPVNFNIAISKYIDDEKKNKAIYVLKFLTSKEMQKKNL